MRIVRLLVLAILGWVLYQLGWALRQLWERDIVRSIHEPLPLATSGETFRQVTPHDTYTREHTIDGSIERVVYRPNVRRYQTSIVMQHGMWHGAWTWNTWGPLLAEWGWEVHTHSLPAHSGSPAQLPIEECTLDYYLRFLKAQIDRHERPPVLLGHSMGGALTQWYLKYVGDLPAAVLVAPWPHELIMSGNAAYFIMADPLAQLMGFITRRAEQCRTPRAAARALLSKNAILSPEELHRQLGPESLLVTMQHLFFWRAPDRIHTPMLILIGLKDAVVNASALRQTALHYGADVREYDGAHNLMHERTYAQIARDIHDWLVARGVG